MTAARAVGTIGLLLILAYVKIQLMPFLLFAALCGALLKQKQGETP